MANPTHVAEDGTTQPGSQDLRETIIDRPQAAETEAAWREATKTEQNRKRTSFTNPQITGGYAPLQTLALAAMRRYGEFSPDSTDGETLSMFIEFANMVIEDLRQHPYWENPEIDYYISITETRQIPDNIMTDGLLYYYCLQQASMKAEIAGPRYFRTMNGTLYNRKFGSGKINMVPWDRSR